MRVRLPYKKGGHPRALEEKKNGNRIFHIKGRDIIFWKGRDPQQWRYYFAETKEGFLGVRRKKNARENIRSRGYVKERGFSG